MKNKFPSIDTVHETLSDLTKLFEDRNAILNSMFKEDKYKDFLLSENIQSLVEADKRDDASGGKIRKDLANGYEILKAKTNMQKFASFISPGMLPTLDLSDEGDYPDDGLDYEDDMYDREEDTKTSKPEKGDKGDKGDPGIDSGVNIESPKSKNFNNRLTQPPSQNSGLKLAEGGAVPPAPMLNALNPSAQRPETKSGVKSLESLGLVGKKNVASELTEDLGLEEYKKALADAMALPLKAVAAGLAGLLDKIDVPSGEGAEVAKQITSIGKAFDIPVKKKENKFQNFVQSGGIFGGISRMFGGGRKKKKSGGGFDTEEAANKALSKNEVIADAQSYYLDQGEWPEGYDGPKYAEKTIKGGPSLGKGGSTHAPDTLSTQGDTKIDAMKNTFNSITQGAKNIFNKTTTGRVFSATTSVLGRLLGGIQPASEGSQYEKQDINNLTNSVMMSNESNMAQKTSVIMGERTEGGREAATKIRELVTEMQKSSSTNYDTEVIAPTEIRFSKYLTSSIVTTHGGETPHDA